MNTRPLPDDTSLRGPGMGGPFDRERLLAVVRRHWGFDALRPLQEQAMRAVLERRDSLLVLPTGGGKSLCYQAPAVYREAPTVVISPLISLMKDQVDGLRACGIAAVQLNSALSSDEVRAAEKEVLDGHARLVFASPERMATGSFRGFLKRAHVDTFAIDEAHCISHWGHDFRPEYRQMKELKKHFPQASVHAFTATATEQVRADIVEQLGLNGADVLVGNFDRPNLSYRVVSRVDQFAQVLQVIGRHAGEAGIIYCVRRKDVDELTPRLLARGIKAVAYHAGMSADERKAAQDQFSDEQCDVVVATVAFGMGIDRSNVRYVLHTGMPKSIEHYQQETGRAGRDGLEAECVLLHGAGDAQTWKRLLQMSVAEAEQKGAVDPQYLESAFRHIADMEGYCRPVTCRHQALVEYFGQKWETDNCGACDLCLDGGKAVADSQTIAKKILSCVYRVQESFGAAHVAAVLRGANTAAVRERGHDKLSTHGLLSDHSLPEVRDYIQQLIGHGLLELAGTEYPVLKLNDASWQVMKDQRSVRLRANAALQEAGEPPSRSSKSAEVSWEGVDRDLFEELRALRMQLASARGVPPYIVFSDATLRELARVRPSSLDQMRLIYGIGEAKLKEFGEPMLAALEQHCAAKNLARDVRTAPAARKPAPPRALSGAAAEAAALFRQGLSIDDVAARLGRARSTSSDYLAEFIEAERPASIVAWVPDELYERVAAVARGTDLRLKPIYFALEEQVPYDLIRLVVAHLRGEGS